jgi:hypothetical protein
VNGPLIGGIAYLQTGNCGFNGENCLIVEITLVCSFARHERTVCSSMPLGKPDHPRDRVRHGSVGHPAVRTLFDLRFAPWLITAPDLGARSPLLLASCTLRFSPPSFPREEAHNTCSYYDGCDGVGANCKHQGLRLVATRAYLGSNTRRNGKLPCSIPVSDRHISPSCLPGEQRTPTVIPLFQRPC